MKFGKRLNSQLEETLPEWRDKYLSYKQLKKRLKLLSSQEPGVIIRQEFEGVIKDGVGDNYRVASPSHGLLAPNCSCSSSSSIIISAADSKSNPYSVINGDLIRSSTAEEVDFIHLLNAELDKFNTFFMEKEEEYVIRLQELKERIDKVSRAAISASSFQENAWNEKMINILRKYIVNFHGEMVLLENYSSLNYTGLVKILKKYDKRTGALLRMPFIQNVLHQPFFTTELLSKLVCECDEMSLQLLFPTPSLSIEENPTITSTMNVDDQAVKAPQEEQKEHSHDDTVKNLRPSDEAAINAQEQAAYNFHAGEDMPEIVHKSIIAALRTIKDIRRGSSTYSIYSLPPFNAKEDSEVSDTIIRNLQCLRGSIYPFT